jgi:hypothetical protein
VVAASVALGAQQQVGHCHATSHLPFGTLCGAFAGCSSIVQRRHAAHCTWSPISPEHPGHKVMHQSFPLSPMDLMVPFVDLCRW